MKNSFDNPTTKNMLALSFIAVLAVIAWSILTMPDQRTTGEKIGDAVDALPQGIDKAAQQLESRTPGEKLGDAVENMGEDIKRNTDRN